MKRLISPLQTVKVLLISNRISPCLCAVSSESMSKSCGTARWRSPRSFLLGDRSSTLLLRVVIAREPRFLGSHPPSTRTLRASSGTKLQRSRPRRVEQPHLVRARRAVLRRSTAATAMRSGCRRASPPSRCRPGTESRTACARSPNARHAKRLLLHRPALRRCSACSTDTCRPALWHRGCSRRQGGGACRCTGRPCTRHAKRLYVCDASLSARNVTPAAPCR